MRTYLKIAAILYLIISLCAWNPFVSQNQQLDLTNNASGVLPVANGGTGVSTGPATVAVTDDTATNATVYPAWFAASTGNLPVKVSTTKLYFNPSTGMLTATGFSGPLTGSASLWGAYATIAGPTQARTYTFPDSAATMLYDGKTSGTFGVASSATGSIALYNLSNANAFTLQPGATGAALSWTLPIAAPGGNNYLINAQTTGALGYTDPATFLAAGGTAADSSKLGGSLPAAYALVGQTMNIGTTTVAINRASAALVLTGITSIDGNAASVTTNANLSGAIASVGNTTSITSQTGTGTKFVVDTSPTLITPALGSATGTALSLGTGAAAVSPMLLDMKATGVNARIYDGAAQAANVGGILHLAGNFVDATEAPASFCYLKGYKLNSTTTDATGGLQVYTSNSSNTLTNRLQVAGSGIVTMGYYGAGAATFDASGNISAVSDERLKIIQGNFANGIESLNVLKPIRFKWNKDSGMETKHAYVGFTAQNVKEAIPEAVYENSEGVMSYDLHAILGALVNTVNDQEKRISALEKQLSVK